MSDFKNPVLVAIRNTPGLATQLGEACGVGRSACWMWCVAGRVPAAHALNVARFMKISPHDVRPDLYPRGLMRRRLVAAD